MNIFDLHFEMLRKNQEIFEKFKLRENIAIEISENIKKDFIKNGKELLSVKEIEYLSEVRSIHYQNVLVKKLEEYTLPEWLVCLNEKVLLEYAIPILSNVLNEYPMLCGMNCEWQVLYEITNLEHEFWQAHKAWKAFYDEMINKIILTYEQDDFEVLIPEEYLYQFKMFRKLEVS